MPKGETPSGIDGRNGNGSLVHRIAARVQEGQQKKANGIIVRTILAHPAGDRQKMIEGIRELRALA